MYKYRVQYDHADTRTTAGELTDETLKGHAVVEVEVDHEILTSEDLNAVAREIGLSNRNPDGSTRFTHVAIKDTTWIELLEFNGFFSDDEPDPKEPLWPSDLRTGDVDAIIMGDSNYLVIWGHDVTEVEAGERLAAILEAENLLSEDVSAEQVVSAIADRGLTRTYARAESRSDDDGLVLSWFHKPGRGYPVSVISLEP